MASGVVEFSQRVAVPELSTRTYSAELRNGDGQPVTPTAILATLRDVVTNQVINGREDQNVLNSNGGTFSAGLFELVLGPDDNPILTGLNYERRLLCLHVEFADGEENRNVHFWVRNLRCVP